MAVRANRKANSMTGAAEITELRLIQRVMLDTSVPPPGSLNGVQLWTQIFL